MPRNGNGVYVLPANSWNPAVTGTTIESSANNATMNDLASAMTQSVSKDGQTSMTGNLPMGNNKLTGLADGSAATDSMSYGQGAKLSGGNTFTGDQVINGSVSLSGSLTVTGPVIFATGTFENINVASVASINKLSVSSTASLNTLNVASVARIAVLNVSSVASVASLNAVGLSINAVAYAYELGTFVPGMTFGGSATGITYSVQLGRYTVEGNLCTVRIQINLTSNGTGVGAALVTGLPFTAAGTVRVAGVLNPISGAASFTGAPIVSLSTGGTTLALFQGSATGQTALTDTNITDTCAFTISITYEV